MAEQRLHSSLATLDVLTRVELESELNKHANAILRQRYLGVDIIRFPKIIIQATGTTLNLFASPNEAPAGPSQGDVWMVRRVLVASSAAADTAKFVLYRGSAPSDIVNAYGPLNLLEGFAAAQAGQAVGVGFYPSTRAIMLEPGEQIYAFISGATAGNTYVLSGEAIRAVAEQKGKLAS